MALLFLNRHLGVINFFVLAGLLAGRHVSVRYLSVAWHEHAWQQGVFAHLSRAEFERCILASIGVVHASGQSVPTSIVEEVNASLASERLLGTNVVDSLSTGSEDAYGAWQIENRSDAPEPVSGRLYAVLPPANETAHR
jgi:hypothetical protein